MKFTKGAELITNERQRQIDAEGFNKGHDSDHVDSELVYSAIHYASPETVYLRREGHNGGHTVAFIDCWPQKWDRKWDKKIKHNRLRQLVIAGALLAAEIDRLLEIDPSLLEDD